jgi:hypothetical protein
MEVSGEVGRLLRENAELRTRVQELEGQLEEERREAEENYHFSMRQSQRLIDEGLWEAGQDEPRDSVFMFAKQAGMA